MPIILYLYSNPIFTLVPSFYLSFQILASASQYMLHPRKRRHALASPQNYKDKFGFVSNGIDGDDHTLAFHIDSSYTAQNRQKKQAGRGAAPHARNVSNFVIILLVIFFLSCSILASRSGT